MLFNSLHFVVFFPIVVVLYFLLKQDYRKYLLLIASYYFYMSWEVEYALLIFLSTFVDYFLAYFIDKTEDGGKKRFLLNLSLAFNLGLLFVFKYLYFFSTNFNSLINYTSSSLFNYDLVGHIPVYELLLPVGISFYTFQTISYTIDVYRNEIKYERDFVKFAVYVSFFPQLVAGPIEKASRLLPQFSKAVYFDYNRFSEGSRRILWGFFKKLVVADRLHEFVTFYYLNSANSTGFEMLVATFIFALQLYVDFSSYTDIAIGAAKILGIDLIENFKRPYLAANITDFWRRWHISLYNWFNNYLFSPIMFNYRHLGKRAVVYAIIVTFILSGLWHGANWQFLVWGLLHALALVFEYLTLGIRRKYLKTDKFITKKLSVAITFCFWLLTCVFFRSNSVDQALDIIQNICTTTLIEVNSSIDIPKFAIVAYFIIYFSDIIEEKKGSIFKLINQKSILLRWSLYFLVFFSICFYGAFRSNVEFIYFQF